MIGTAVSSDIAGPEVSGEQPPTHYVYRGQDVDLPLDLDRIAVTYRVDTTSQGRASSAAAVGVSLSSSQPTRVGRWHLLHLERPLAHAADASARVAALLDAPQVEFASPVFHGAIEGSWLAVTPGILLRFRPEFADSGEALLPIVAPGSDLVSRNLGNMTGAFRLRSRARDGFSVLAEANALARDPRVAWAEPDMQFSGRGDVTPNDPAFDDLWGHRNTGQFGGTPGIDIGAESAWDTTTGSGTIKVLVLDTGIQLDHPDLIVTAGTDLVLGSPDGGPVNACDNHGTRVAGPISALLNNNLGTVGTAPDVSLLSARVFAADTGSPCPGTWTSMVSWTIDALTWGEAQGARVSNNSNGYGFTSQAIDDTYAATYNLPAGMVHFASSGNSGSATVDYPASISVVNAVSNVAPDGSLYSTSSFGPEISVAAPGRLIYTTDRTGADGAEGDYLWVTGTSYSAPHAAGVAALILSANPSLSPQEVEAILYCSARDLGAPGRDDLFGHGMVNAAKALSASTGVDSDTDGVDDVCDNCPGLANLDQADADQDGVGDVCDGCPDDFFNDLDGDGHCADVDNCPDLANPMQIDLNGNAVGDACECTAASLVIDGESAADLLAWRARGAGDVDNDGVNDLIVGALRNDQVAQDAGKAYVYSGRNGSLLYALTGEAASDNFGMSVAGLGDVNGDGYGDVVVGAPYNDAGGTLSNAGRAYLFFGGPGPYPVTIAAASADRIFTGAAVEENVGWEVARIDSVDADTFADLLIGAPNFDRTTPGRAYVVSSADGSIIHELVGEAIGDNFGYSVADAGDVTGDLVPDVIVGAIRNSAAASEAGRAYVHSGVDGSLFRTFSGEAAADWFGGWVAGVGDVDQDNRADLLIGATYNDDGGMTAGRAYLYSGQGGGSLLTVTGDEAFARLGESVSGMADVDGDGIGDLAVAAPSGGVPGHHLAGRVFLMSSQSGNVVGSLSGEVDNDAFGRTVDGNWDLNNDGIADLIVGAYLHDSGGPASGRVYVYLLGDADGDGFAAACDSCATLSNPLQSDSDGDGIGNLCDACPLVADAGDTDGDGAADACDCRPSDPNDLPPGDVAGLSATRLPGQSVLLSWQAAAGADTYSVTRGDLATLGPSSYGGCLAEGIVALAYEDTEVPASGQGFAYLVQGQSLECGLGLLGFDSAENVRTNLDAGACTGS